MSVPFTEFRLIYPPHPALTWKPDALNKLPTGRYAAQYKYDDWRVLIYFFPDGKIRLFSRKKAPLPRYRLPAETLRSLQGLALPHHKFHVLDGGLLHYKTPRIRDTFVLWDVLVYNGRHLLGTNYRERYRLLESICRHPRQPVCLDSVRVALSVAPRLWFAPIIKGAYKQAFERTARLPEIEGIVLKDLRLPLERAARAEKSARWQIRVRKPRIDYRF